MTAPTSAQPSAPPQSLPRTAASFNLWVLFVRFIVPQKHTEAKRGRRWFPLIAARLVQSGRQKEVQVSICGSWAEQLKNGYLRLHDWIRTTALQLKKVEAIPT